MGLVVADNRALSGAGGVSDNFPFQFVFFPAASFLSGERFRVVVMVTWIAVLERGVINLLTYPSLARDYGRVAVVALFCGITDHFIYPPRDLYPSNKLMNVQSLCQCLSVSHPARSANVLLEIVGSDLRMACGN